VASSTSPFANEAAMALIGRACHLGAAEMQHLLLSGGSEATETAMKLAHQYHLERGREGKYRIISRWISYHGNTIGALSMSSPYLGRSSRISKFPKIHRRTAVGVRTKNYRAVGSPAPRTWSG
jgi:adenosylmethionine-8-amino-7-oxononanoate aminotransferase